MKKPSIWFLTDAPWAGGAERYLEYQLAGRSTGELGILAVQRPGLQDWLSAREAEGIPLRRIVAGNRWQELRGLHAALRELRPQVLHCNLPGPYEAILGLAPLVARRSGVARIIVTEHLPGVGRVGKRWWGKRAALVHVDAAICVCEAHRSAMRHLGYAASRVHPIVNGIPDPNPERHLAAARRVRLPEDLSSQFLGSGPLVVQVGSLDLRKGAHHLIESMRGLDARLLLVGDGPQRKALQEQLREAGLVGRVVLAGHRPDVSRIWAAADLAVLASEQEGLPLSLLEAAAHGLPMISTKVDGIPEVVLDGRTGLLVDRASGDSLRRAIAEVLTDGGLRRRWGQAARDHFEANFTLERMQAATQALWEGQ